LETPDVVVTQEDMARLGAKLHALAETLDAPSAPCCSPPCRAGHQGWAARQMSESDDEVAGFALPAQPGGVAVTISALPPPPSVFLGAGMDSISARDPQSGLPTGRRSPKPIGFGVIDISAIS
jgi:hypothetical protein